MMQSSARMLALVTGRGSSGSSRLMRRTLVSRTLALPQDLPYHLVVGLPALSPTMNSGTLAEWYLQEGDSFAAGDALAKIETDKAAMDFEAQDDGFVAKILAPAGQGNDIAIGTPIMITVEEAGDIAAFQNYTSPPPAAVVEAPTVVAAAEPVVVAATATVAAPPPPPVAPSAAPVVPPPLPVTAAAPPALAATVAPLPTTSVTAAFSTAWGLSVVHTSPLARTLDAEQNDFISKYGSTGQKPILSASS